MRVVVGAFEVRPLRFLYCALLAVGAYSWGGWPGAVIVVLASADLES